MAQKNNSNTTSNLMKLLEGDSWYGDCGTAKPAMAQVEDCKPGDRPKFKNNKELTAFIRAKLAVQRAKV